MKKQFLLFAVFSLLLTATYAQKIVKDANAVARDVKGYHAIEISNGIDLYLTQGNEEAVAVSAAKDDDRDKIVTKVEAGVLKIYYEKNERGWGISWGNKKMKAYVSVKTIDGLSASGGADVSVDGVLNGTNLAVSLSGGSDLKGKLSLKELSLSASGGSDATLSGKADKFRLQASGGSDVHAYDLVTENCTVSSSGGSDVFITANQTIRADASGGSDLHYKGNASVTSSKSGGSSVKKVG